MSLTAGGGGKSEKRLAKVKERNKELHGQRTKKLEAQPDVFPERPQRFSSTSGVEQPLVKKRTWTVGDVDDGETHRGGVKHAKKRGKSKSKGPGRAWGTGVNSIPVG